MTGNRHSPPLNSAAFSGQLEFIQILLDHGAKIDSDSDSGENAFTYAEMRGFSEVADFLREQGLSKPEAES